MKKDGEVLHAKVPAILAAVLCGFLPGVDNADDLKVPRTGKHRSESCYLAIGWSCNQYDAAVYFAPRVVVGFLEISPVGADGLPCNSHVAIGALVSYSSPGAKVDEGVKRVVIAWGRMDGHLDSGIGKGFSAVHFLPIGHVIASKGANARRFMPWSESAFYAAPNGPGRYSYAPAAFQRPKSGGFTPREEVSEVKTAKFEEQLRHSMDRGILHVKTSLVRMAIAIGLLPKQGSKAPIVLPANAISAGCDNVEARASIVWGSGSPYREVVEEATRLVAGFLRCEPIGGRQSGDNVINVRGVRIYWKEGSSQNYADLMWYGENGSVGNLPRGWVLARCAGSEWAPLAPCDRYRAPPKSTRYTWIPRSEVDAMVAHARKCAEEPKSAWSPLRGPDLKPRTTDAIAEQEAAPRISWAELGDEPIATPAQRRSIIAMLLANRKIVPINEVEKSKDKVFAGTSLMMAGWRDEQIGFLAPGVPNAVKEIREYLGLELMSDEAAAQEEMATLLGECAKIRGIAERAIVDLERLHSRIDEISRWLADPSAPFPAQPVAFAS